MYFVNYSFTLLTKEKEIIIPLFLFNFFIFSFENTHFKKAHLQCRVLLSENSLSPVRTNVSNRTGNNQKK